MFTSNISLVTLVRGVGGKLSRLVYLAPRLGFGSQFGWNNVHISFNLIIQDYGALRMNWWHCSTQILGRGQDKPAWTACPPPLVNTFWSKHLRLTETKYSCSRWCNKIRGISILSEILGGGQDKPPWTACPPPLVNQYVTQLNLWSKHLRLTETKYSCSRWCNKIWRLSILSEILGRGQDKPPWTACPLLLINR